ncbi:MAG: hypothetical protein LBC40_07310 [Dysgonamonadaceae bacterium]|jgi:hypothetical protein|nr:hypothetical protein [Dysgonamonadaceae bacterium]
MLSLWSCSTEETPFLPLEDDGAAGELQELLRYYEREYGMVIKNEFAPTDFAPVSVGYELKYTSTTDAEGIITFLEYLEENVLSYFPKDMLYFAMPRTVFLVDELSYLFEYNDKIKPEKWSEYRPVAAGYVTDRYLVFANASARFNPDAEGLKEELMSLVIERLVSGSIINTYPINDFAKISLDATYASGFDPNASLTPAAIPYIDGLTSFKTWDLITGGQAGTPWLGRGVLEPGRLGYMSFSDRMIIGLRITAYSYDKCTIAKDFADFTVFVLTKTAAEKEAFYTAVAENDELNVAEPSHVEKQYAWVVERDGVYYDSRYPLYGGRLGADAIRDKVEFVKTWWTRVGYPLEEPE